MRLKYIIKGYFVDKFNRKLSSWDSSTLLTTLECSGVRALRMGRMDSDASRKYKNEIYSVVYSFAPSISRPEARGMIYYVKYNYMMPLVRETLYIIWPYGLGFAGVTPFMHFFLLHTTLSWYSLLHDGGAPCWDLSINCKCTVQQNWKINFKCEQWVLYCGGI